VRAAILTISTSAARGTREDRSGDALARLAGEAGAQIAARDVAADDRLARPTVDAEEDAR